ncbi:endonuclease/exonuclease/phosphatase family protein [Algoriphagus terrigena]|uniref:endonuclease/exonuclease/phosphatase family protein n=1 Tax=Algoriphagus terrigena TaxID=344884 RepID=UPI000405FC37|nr:endonuclease/exonuclease/phosphatase family protein [Algoriphagus terrigena]
MRYYGLKNDFDANKRKVVAKQLIDLKKDLSSKVPEKQTNGNLLIATWNIRDFNSNKYGHGYRLQESFYYIAEIISSFDLVAVQEVNKDMSGLSKLMYILGQDWDYICTDVTEGHGGNMERMAFIYDVRRVTFKKVAGEIVLPQNNSILKGTQFARTPFMVSFQSGWSKFSLCTAHIFFGSNSGQALNRRIDEINSLSAFLRKRADNDLENVILLGDFNIINKEHETMEVLLKNGFTIPKTIYEMAKGTNMFRDKFYDQIAVYSKLSQFFKLVESEKSAGCYDYFKQVFRNDDFDFFKPSLIRTLERREMDAELDLKNEELKTEKNFDLIKKLKNTILSIQNKLKNDQTLNDYYNCEWKTFQMSDHLPLWAELVTDHSESYLLRIMETQNFEI